MRKEDIICSKKKVRCHFILNKKSLSCLYHTYLGLVRPDALTVRLFSQFSCSADPREQFLSPDSHDLPHVHRRLFPPFPLHFASSFFQIILRRAHRVSSEGRTEKHPLKTQ